MLMAGWLADDHRDEKMAMEQNRKKKNGNKTP